jgi:hypothetical protein
MKSMHHFHREPGSITHLDACCDCLWHVLLTIIANFTYLHIPVQCLWKRLFFRVVLPHLKYQWSPGLNTLLPILTAFGCLLWLFGIRFWPYSWMFHITTFPSNSDSWLSSPPYMNSCECIRTSRPVLLTMPVIYTKIFIYYSSTFSSIVNVFPSQNDMPQCCNIQKKQLLSPTERWPWP